MPDIRSCGWWPYLGAAALAVQPVAARPLEGVREPAEPFRYMRISEDPGRTVALEIASRTFEPPASASGGPSIALVGVAHIGERTLYDSVQDLLDRHDVVLYESVKPAGTGGAGGSDLTERTETTLTAMEFTAAVVKAYKDSNESYPPDPVELSEFAAGRDPRVEQWLSVAATDAWGSPVLYRVTEGGAGFELVSFGADRRPGGEGEGSDLRVGSDSAIHPASLGSDEDNLQAELAKALGLAFQLDALDYGRAHFRCSDLAMDQLERAFRDKGVDFGPIGGSLAGSSLPGRLVVYLLRLIRVVDVFLDGAIADALKVMLIELFSSDKAMEMSMKQFGTAFEDVIIDQRNQVVVDDVKSILEKERDVESIAILYGAAHMPDLADRLIDQLGYEPGGEEWFTAFEVDLTRSAMSPGQLQTFRQMVRQQLRQMAGKP